MSFLRLITRSLVHYRRQHAGLLLGSVLACAILTGALIVGDSVKQSLRTIAEQRLGNIDFALQWSQRLFSQTLADRIASAGNHLKPAAVLLLRGNVAGTRVQVVGVDDAFWTLAPEPVAMKLGPQEAAINQRTAQALGVRVGDDISLRTTKPSTMPLDAPLASRKDDQSASALVTVTAIVEDNQLGRFSLAAEQSAPCNVFVSRDWLQEQVGQPNMANLLCVSGGSLSDAQHAVDTSWELEDIGLRLRAHPSGVVQLESSRVFLEDEVVKASLTIPGAKPTLTYLVSSIAKGDRSTPYSFAEAGPASAGMRDDEAIINQWLADQLTAAPSDTISVEYLRWLPQNTFETQRKVFKVRDIAPMADWTIERELAPQFPGLSDVENCRDWSIGLPMDPVILKDAANEEYWRQYGQTPKMLLTFEAGRGMWATPFGSVTAIRFPAPNTEDIDNQLRKLIRPAGLGLSFAPVKDIARTAVDHAMDFGGLFAGMSSFLIIAALIMLGLLFSLALQERAPETGILAAMGFPASKIRMMHIGEALPALAAGSALGVAAGIAYAGALVAALQFLWPAAVAGTPVQLHISASSAATGALLAFLTGLIVMLATVFRATRRTSHDLLSNGTTMPSSARGRVLFTAGVIALGAAVALAVHAWLTKPRDMTEPFFMVGGLCLIAGLLFAAWLLVVIARRATFAQPRLWKISVANMARRRGRSLSIAALTACGCFVVFTVGSMRENFSLHADDRASGTGGFGVFAETTAPLLGNPDEIARKVGAPSVAIRVHDGDDAGCLNLNQAQSPRVLGVDANAFAKTGAFTGADGGSLWRLLTTPLPDGAVPALVGDSNTAMWGLKKKTGPDGDLIRYTDASGKNVNLKLVGCLPMRLSVFQGSLLIANESFTQLFPAESGFRMLLVESGANDAAQTAARLNKEFAKAGMAASPSVQRLRDFYAVESTYLAMFLVLGGLGMALGAGGIAIVILRNLFERRAEWAILHAVGYDRNTITRIVLMENAALVTAGLLIGALAAAAAIVPLVITSQTSVSAGVQTAMLVIIVAAYTAAVAIAVGFGIPRKPLAAFRRE